MEAQRKERCDFIRQVNGEFWKIDMVWVKSNGQPAWYDGSISRNGVKFYRIFSPDEIDPPAVTYAKESDNPNRL